MDTQTEPLPPAQLFAEAFEGSENSPEGERRLAKRHDYVFTQWIAPCSGPDVSVEGLRFFPVRCCDLSTGGLSFHINFPPTFEYAVVRLGTRDASVHVLAEVVRCQFRHNEKEEYRLGCRFLRKIDCR